MQHKEPSPARALKAIIFECCGFYDSAGQAYVLRNGMLASREALP